MPGGLNSVGTTINIHCKRLSQPQRSHNTNGQDAQQVGEKKYNYP